jgi:hypothetical protein
VAAKAAELGASELTQPEALEAAPVVVVVV